MKTPVRSRHCNLQWQMDGIFRFRSWLNNECRRTNTQHPPSNVAGLLLG
jgi:hypothetical protein